jgi:hypothetical protein
LIGLICLLTGSRPHDVLNWTRTEREVAGQCAMAAWGLYTDFWTKMYEAVYGK